MTNCYHCGGKINTTTSTQSKPYIYLESGLDNVQIVGVKQHACQKCKNTYVEIPKIKELHKCIASLICQKKECLVGQEIKFLRKEMKMKSSEFALLLGISAEHMSRLEKDAKKTSPSLDKLIRTLYIIYTNEGSKHSICKGTISQFSKVAAKEPPKHRKSIKLKFPEWASGGDLCSFACLKNFST